jgi:lambda family phage minor tail protein L
MSIENEVRQGWHDAIIEMFEIDLSTIPGASGSYFFTKEVMPDNSKVSWKGQVYEPFPIEASGFELTAKGQIPKPQLVVANVLGTLGAVISSAEDLVGAKVTRRRTLFKYLDNGTSPDSSQEFPEDIYYIERKVAESNITIAWELASKIDLEGLQLPRRIITQNYCLWKYRGPECGYAGPPVATPFDGPLTGGSAASQAYLNAVRVFNEAEAALRSAEDAANAARDFKDRVCDVDVITRGDDKFNLRRSNSDPVGVYTFYLEDRGEYFASYDENVLVPKSDFNFEFGQEELGNAIPGEKQNTGRGPGGEDNGTGPIYAVNLWLAVYAENIDPEADNLPIDLILGSENYSPPQTFSFFDLENSPIICVDGTIRGAEGASVQLNTPPGEKPSLSDWPPNQQRAFAMGSKRNEGVYPVRNIQRYTLDSSQCDSATDEYDNAQAELEAAQAAYDAALAALNAAIAALPEDDELYKQDQCGKRLTSCKLRFPNSTLPFGAFPGANLPR